VFFL
ncbi:putative minor tail protein, partial [Escherichia coli 90.2281]|jgi:hypothetical protein